MIAGLPEATKWQVQPTVESSEQGPAAHLGACAQVRHGLGGYAREYCDAEARLGTRPQDGGRNEQQERVCSGGDTTGDDADHRGGVKVNARRVGD